MFSSGLLRLSLLAVAAVLLLPLGGCRKVPPKHSGEAADGARDLALWEVSRDGEVDYLFGTCHIGVALDEALPRAMRDLVTGSQLFVMEADVSEMMRPEVGRRLLLEDGVTVDGLLGAEDWQKLVDEFGLQDRAHVLTRMHPFALISFIVQEMAKQEAGPGTAGAGMMDLALSGLAQSAGVKAGYLETANQQIDLFLDRDVNLWIDDLREMLDPANRADMNEKMAMILGVCRQSDWTDALAYLAEERETEGDWQEALLMERNRNWIPTLEAFFAEGQVFAAGGAAHMIGPGSVVELLRAQGYTVRQMRGVTVPRSEIEGGDRAPGEAPKVSRENFLGLLGSQLPPLLCSENAPFMACYGGATDRCVEEAAKALPVCAAKVELPEWIEGAEGSDWGRKLGECIGVETQAGLSDVFQKGPGCGEEPEGDSGAEPAAEPAAE